MSAIGHIPQAAGPVVFLGSATWDAIAVLDELPARDQRHVASQLRWAGGGPAATAAVAAARCGVPEVCFVGVVGDGVVGDIVVAGLADEGVDVTGVIRVAGSDRGSSIVLVESVHGTRTIVNRPSLPPDLAHHPAAAELVAGAAWVHVDHVGWAALDSLGAPRRGRLSVDGGNVVPGYRPHGVAWDVPTEAALRTRYGALELPELLAAALADGAEVVVATRGADGAAAASRDGTTATAAGVAVEVVSTLGAGDVFHGALVAAAVRGEPLQYCLRYANTVAALSCQGLDGRSAIPTHPSTVAALARQRDLEPTPTGSAL